MAEIIVTGLAGLMVAGMLYGLATKQWYYYRVNRRVRALKRIRRGQ